MSDWLRGRLLEDAVENDRWIAWVVERDAVVEAERLRRLGAAPLGEGVVEGEG